MKHWRCCLGLGAWLLMVATAIFSVGLNVLLTETVLQKLASAGGVWGYMPFAFAAIAVCIGILAMLSSGFGWGAIRGSWFGIPPAWVVGVVTILAFWFWLWCLGPEPHSYPHWVLAHGLTRLHTVFSHGWVWLWGAVISCGLALAMWQAVLPRLLAHCGNRLRTNHCLGRQLAPLSIDDVSPRAHEISRTERESQLIKTAGVRTAHPLVAPGEYRTDPNTQNYFSSEDWSLRVHDLDDTLITSWLQGNDNPLHPSDRDLFYMDPSPARVLARLQPTHLYGDAGTLALIGLRGAGKSSLLRRTEGLSKRPQSMVELRFVYVSLWEYKTAQAPIQDMIGKVLNAVCDRIDIFPFTGAGVAFVRAMTGDGRFHWLSDACGLYNSIDDIIEALSAMLLWNKLRVIICIEDDDRLTNAAQKKQFLNLITGSIDFLRRFPGFGYVLCVSGNDWSELQRAALNNVEPPEKQRERLEIIGQALPPQPRGSTAGPANESDAQRETAVQPSARTEPSSDGRQSSFNPQTPNEVIKSQISKDIEILRRAATIAARKQLGGFDTSRLCRGELVIPPLAHEQWRPILESVRGRMFELVGQSPEAICFGLDAQYANGQANARQKYANGRQLVWSKLIDKLTSPPFSIGRPMPEYGIANAERTGFSFTPRSLRRGLADAWRKWLAIQDSPHEYIRILDPDSVLVACLVRACRPDVWNILIRDESLLRGGDWPVTDYLVQHAINKTYTQMRKANKDDKDLPRYGQDWPHLGLSQEIINMMRKSCQVSASSTAPEVPGTNAPELVEKPLLPTVVRTNPSLAVLRPGGLIGSLPGESSSGSSSNWRRFLNA